ncbi:MAG: hypothetical protein R3E50_06110 [Halioglobus sp.]
MIKPLVSAAQTARTRAPVATALSCAAATQWSHGHIRTVELIMAQAKGSRMGWASAAP